MRSIGSRASSDVARRRTLRAALADDRGAATVEWTLVSALLTLLFLAVLQLGFALHIRATLLDAAAEGARTAGLVGAVSEDGRDRTAELITLAVASHYASNIEVVRGPEVAIVTVRAPLPVIGVWGFPDGIEVVAHAPVER